MNPCNERRKPSPSKPAIQEPLLVEGGVMRAVAIVRLDLVSGKDLDNLRAVARRMRIRLASSDIHVTNDLSALLAHVACLKPDIVVTPAEPHLRGWMDTVRQIAPVWTVDPLLCWPQTGERPHRLLCPEKPPDTSNTPSDLPHRVPGETFRQPGHGTLPGDIDDQIAQSFVRDLPTLRRIAHHLRIWPTESAG